ncbi:MAG TPA: hemolysin III family protein [Acidimicrobiales bacterium]|nr:hemolysin III family protein [Acidimicrobiales bacterium]
MSVEAHDQSPAEAALTAVAPLLRGWLHLVCFVLSVPAGAALVAGAGSSRARVAGAVYAAGLSALFGVSAAYHRRRWSPAARRRMRRLDHATIFVMIAGSYTPLCVVALGGGLGTAILVVVWVGAALGAAFALFDVARKVSLASYIVLGWVMAVALPQLAHRVGGGAFALIVAGGLLYTVGGLVLARRRPDPVPAVFGYHEVWHVMVATAATCHYLAIASVVRSG